MSKKASFLLVLTLSLMPVPAPAQEAEAPPPQETYRLANEHIANQRWQEARELLLQLWPTTRTHDVAASLGQVEYKLGNYPSSAWYMAFAVANVPPKEKPEVGERYRAGFAKAKEHVATLIVKVSPPEAEIYVDAEKAMVSPQGEIFVRPGSHSLEAMVGTDSVLQSITVEAGTTHDVELVVDVKPKPAPAATPTAPAPATPAPATEPEPEARSPLPIYAGAALAAVGLGVGIGFGLASSSSDDDAQALKKTVGSSGCTGASPSSDCEALRDAIDSRDTQATIANVGFLVGALAGAATLTYALWPRSEKSGAEVQAQALVAPNGGGLSVRGAF